MSQNVFNRKQYTKVQHKAMTNLFALSSLNVDAPNILVRINTHNLSADPSTPEYFNYDDTDTFVLATSSSPKDVISYFSPQDFVDLNVRDGGYF
jgi:hypothetical protein